MAGSPEVKAALALARTMRRPAGPLLAWLDQVDRSARALCEVPAYLATDPTAGLATLLAATSAAERPVDPRQARRLAPDLPSRRTLAETNRTPAGHADRPTIVPAGLVDVARARENRSTVPVVPPSRGRGVDRHALAQLRDAVRRGALLPASTTTARGDGGLSEARPSGRFAIDPLSVARGLVDPASQVDSAASVADADWDDSQRVPLALGATTPASRGLDSTSEIRPRAYTSGLTDLVGQAASDNALELPRHATPRASPPIQAAIPGHARDPMDAAIHTDRTTRELAAPTHVTTAAHVVAPAAQRPSLTRLPTAAPAALGAGVLDDSVTAMAEALWRNGIDPS